MPVNCYLTNRDVLTPVKGMVERLVQCQNVRRVVILDCQSTYEPLLNWYQSRCEAEVIYCSVNQGSRAPWNELERLGEPEDEFYFVSDADLDISNVPLDFLDRLQDGLRRYPHAIKSGLSLRIDDLDPEHVLTERIHGFERQYWEKPLDEDWYDAAIDTVAAVYRRGTGWGGYEPAIRAAPPYMARHLSWYLTKANVTEEWLHYFNNLNPQEVLWAAALKDYFHS